MYVIKILCRHMEISVYGWIIGGSKRRLWYLIRHEKNPAVAGNCGIEK